MRALRVEKVFLCFFYAPLALAGAPAGMSTYVYVDGEGDAFRGGGAPQGRKPVQRRTVDYTATTVRHIEVRGDLARDPTTTRRPTATGRRAPPPPPPPVRGSFAATAPLLSDPPD